MYGWSYSCDSKSPVVGVLEQYRGFSSKKSEKPSSGVQGEMDRPCFLTFTFTDTENQTGANQSKVQKCGFRWDCGGNPRQARAGGFQTMFSRVMVKYSLEDEWNKKGESSFSATISVHFFPVVRKVADDKSESQPAFERRRTSLMGKLPVFEMSPYWLEGKSRAHSSGKSMRRLNQWVLE